MLQFREELFIDKGVVTMKFSEIPDLFTSAEEEVLYNKQGFEATFYDINNTYEKISDVESRYMYLIGRKGTGKSAYSIKINYPDDNKVIETTTLLSNENFLNLSAISKAKGPMKYNPLWKLCLLFEIIRHTKEHFSNKGMKKIKKVFNDIGLSIDGEIVESFNKITTKSINLALNSVFQYTTSTQISKRDNINEITAINDFLITKIQENIIDKKPLILSIDGLDLVFNHLTLKYD